MNEVVGSVTRLELIIWFERTSIIDNANALKSFASVASVKGVIMRHVVASRYTPHCNYSDRLFSLDGLSDNVCYWCNGVRCTMSYNSYYPELQCVG